MGLRWPILLVPIIVAIVAALWWSRRRANRHGLAGELPLLARSYRLTELPEYQRAVRRHQQLCTAALVLALVTVTGLLGAALRPTRTEHPATADSQTPYVDIMLCFGPLFDLQFAQELGLAPLMSALRAKVNDFANQRIGMTNQFYRVFPVTADRRWVSERMGAIADLAKASSASSGEGSNDAVFQRDSSGGKVSANVVDTLAMCTMGLPAAGTDNGRARQLIYIGDTRLPDDPGHSTDDPPDARLYSKTLLAKTITAAGIQVDAIDPNDQTGAAGFVETLVDDTGGQRIRYTRLEDPEATGGTVAPKHVENQQAELSGAVQQILSHPPPSALDRAQQSGTAPFRWDVPDLALQLALLAAVGLAAARLGMRL
jgi:Ca-activated chloride channel family protein